MDLFVGVGESGLGVGVGGEAFDLDDVQSELVHAFGRVFLPGLVVGLEE